MSAMSESQQESKDASEFRKWFAENGGFIHQSIHLKQVDSGLSVCASETMPADATVMTCPFSLAITPNLCKDALSNVFKTSTVHEKWTEKQLICAYICLHWVLSSDLPPALVHLPYLNILPGQDKLRTPLHFTEDENLAFKGTNLYRMAVETRREEWQQEWRECQRDIEAHDESVGKGFTWEYYLTAATYVSSRAFPSTILSATPSLQLTDTSHPILLPGIDSLNHARGTPVSWVISSHADAPTALAVNLVLHSPASAGEELFNNYGPKPNSELILGYGFALPANPSDTIVLQIGVGGGAAPAKGMQKKLEVGRNASGAAAVWDEVLALVSSNSSEPTYEDELEAAGMLGDMLLALQDRLPDVENAKENDKIRPEVKEMLEYYVEGQRDIIKALLDFAQGKEKAAIEVAQAQGIDLVFDEEEEFVDVEDSDEADEQYEDA